MKHIYLMRHGQSTANADQTVSGAYDAPLSPLGQQQAALAAPTVRRFFKPDAIVTSPLARARQTAELVAAGIGYPIEDIVALPELRERNLGDIEGRPKSEVPNQYTANIEDIENIPGQESLEDFYRRLQTALQKIQAMPQNAILVVAHNGSGRMLRAVAHGKPASTLHDQPRFENACVYQIV